MMPSAPGFVNAPGRWRLAPYPLFPTWCYTPPRSCLDDPAALQWATSNRNREDAMEALTSGWLGSLLLAWVVITVLWLLLLAYRSRLASREEDQLFLSKGEEHSAQDQDVLVTRLIRLSMPIWVLGITCGGLIVLIVGLWIWQGLRTPIS